MKYDFDKIVNRRNTASYKWDSVSAENVIPLWVADMDFQTTPEVIQALHARVEHGVFGYVKVPDGYYDALESWFERKHGWKIDRKNVIYTSGVVPAISAIIKALTRPGDGVIVQTPAYNCFFSSIRNNGCVIVENPLKRIDSEDSFSYEFDWADLEEKASDPTNKLMILCNPHNPSGRVWTNEELSRVSEISHRYGVIVVSDEIHCELTMPRFEYTPYASVDSKAIICCSPSKAFNIAGLQIANIVAPSQETLAIIDRAINDNEVCDVNPFGVEALIAAYNHGEEWLERLREYLYGNYQMLLKFFRENLPHLRVGRIEATYLAWVDISPLGIGSTEFEERMLRDAKVWINAGDMYHSDGYVRINMACPKAKLIEGLTRLADAIKKL